MSIKISIVTITYNAERTVRDTFESILRQRFRPLEYIIVDGGSTDSTISIINDYQVRFKLAGIEIKYKSEKDKGISDAFNKGIAQATGDIIGIINADDKLVDNSLNIIAEAFDPEIGVYYGDCIIFNDSHSQEYLAKPKFSQCESLLRTRMVLYHPAVFISRRTYKLYGVYDLELKMCMDRELLLRFYSNNVKFRYLGQPLAYYREGGTNQANYKKTANENEMISAKYGMTRIEAKIRKHYWRIHDQLWKIIQYLNLERIFHKRIV